MPAARMSSQALQAAISSDQSCVCLTRASSAPRATSACRLASASLRAFSRCLSAASFFDLSTAART
eukprot:CAMPEP_0195137720 /NCGR_PEP_ID=MMETSP0448-20130528/156459_1 /TAXON_ID=66468 /ORGANISM="Heterocapsa triquestra, Strain CCMP 448" /LENGTH=65 /DNA_ID=CAMNT_0040175963 /DNA_START=47 /DNA_END=240 /DNA_ORIENTATION=+